jgi:hypothetical protein
MSTQDFGTCPHCAARIELGAPPGPGRCPRCAGLYMPVVPEADPSEANAAEANASEANAAEANAAESSATAAQPREWVLLPQHAALDGATRGVRAWLDARGLARPLFAWMIAAVLCLVALLAAGLSAELFEPGPETRRAFGRVLGVLLLPFALLLIALPAALVVRLLFGGRRPGEPRAFWRSLIAVSLGVGVLWAVVSVVQPALTPLLGRGWSATLLSYALACLAAGWLSVRIASEQPYRHALGVGLVLVLGFALLLLPFGGRAFVSVLFYLALVPVLWLGAWLRVHTSSPRTG